MRHLEKLVQQGKVDASLLEAARRSADETSSSGLPTEVINRRKEYVYEHKAGLVPAPRWNDKRYMQMGTRISMGRARWSIEDASIFSVSDGKRLAQEPPPMATHYERIRLNKVARAAYESPTMAGLRLLPKFTPGRALLWGTILALWGTGAVVATTAKQLEISTSDEVSNRLRPMFGSWAASLAGIFAPLRHSLSINAVAGDAMRQDAQQSELVRRLRRTML
ncbi:hypothetical protein D9Q98_002903 [Chlorella vulgaris]|uniref:Uncharacterized protein n=1 Tax=Chlorella vulgaris TaxID=3077 RepID=A0A9D4TUM5_CHLVU|nr:hypothetical protein D9Q98_002903 [Chlorella vulgaris]